MAIVCEREGREHEFLNTGHNFTGLIKSTAHFNQSNSSVQKRYTFKENQKSLWLPIDIDLGKLKFEKKTL